MMIFCHRCATDLHWLFALTESNRILNLSTTPPCEVCSSQQASYVADIRSLPPTPGLSTYSQERKQEAADDEELSRFSQLMVDE